jgi:hypothetical protein
VALDDSPGHSDGRCFWVLERNLLELARRIAALARRAQRLGTGPIAVRATGERRGELVRVVLAGEPPALAGWMLIAAVDHRGPVPRLRFVSASASALDPRRFAEAHCDHCGLRRRRTATYVLWHAATSRVRQVGSRWDASESEADLVTVRVNGRGERNLTRSPGIVDRAAVWSPDGREIVFMRDDSGLENDIATIRPDGSHLRALTNTPTDEESPDWSPDGKRIVFHWNAAPPGEDWDIYVMRGDGGSPPTRLTTAEGFTPVWSPDGRKIVFSNDELFTMRADGSRQKRVRPGFDGHHPDWQPVRKAARAEDDDD